MLNSFRPSLPRVLRIPVPGTIINCSDRQYSGCPSIYGLGLDTDSKFNKISCIMRYDSNLLTEMKYSKYIDYRYYMNEYYQ